MTSFSNTSRELLYPWDGASQAGGRDQPLCPGSHQLALDNKIQPEESELLWTIQGENLMAINHLYRKLTM
jgi:hypothetical protein